LNGRQNNVANINRMHQENKKKGREKAQRHVLNRLQNRGKHEKF